MNVSAYKIGSGECNNYPLIEHIASFGRPMIVNTGMNNIIISIKKGEILTKENVWVKRPGTGEIKAGSYNDVLGKVAYKDVEIDKHLSWSNLNE
jgi:sialic acid synthase SpsE